MVELSRTVRFAVGPGQAPGEDGGNGFAGRPGMVGIGTHYELSVRCRGEPGPDTGYLIDIKQIDRAVREACVPVIAQKIGSGAEPTTLLAELVEGAEARLPVELVSLRWDLSPYYSVEMETRNMSKALIRQRFDFAASHRLHAPSLSDQQNRELFGKCNHANGHGHNYQVEACVEVDAGDPPVSLGTLERLVDEWIIEPFDHKHLNLDTEEFGEGGLNPSVENIARVCYERLEGPIASLGSSTLRSVTVWETDRTCCTYPA